MPFFTTSMQVSEINPVDVRFDHDAEDDLYTIAIVQELGGDTGWMFGEQGREEKDIAALRKIQQTALDIQARLIARVAGPLTQVLTEADLDVMGAFGVSPDGPAAS